MKISHDQLSPKARIRYYEEILALLGMEQTSEDRLVIQVVEQQIKKAEEEHLRRLAH
ncbi:MAG: hypothetical protein GY705_06875 [Bacteroidetes bacterium]|nr:hypothetical protein [Bacteroidota bacterium]